MRGVPDQTKEFVQSYQRFQMGHVGNDQFFENHALLKSLSETVQTFHIKTNQILGYETPKRSNLILCFWPKKSLEINSKPQSLWSQTEMDQDKTWKAMVRRWIFFWDGLFSEAMLVSRSVTNICSSVEARWALRIEICWNLGAFLKFFFFFNPRFFPINLRYRKKTLPWTCKI